MLKLAIVLMTLATPLAAQQSTPLAAQEAAPSAVTAPAAPSAAPTATKISASAMARDPRMIAAIRHANALADAKCGGGVGAIVDLSTKAEAQRCRRRMIDNAKLDAESEIENH